MRTVLSIQSRRWWQKKIFFWPSLINSIRKGVVSDPNKSSPLGVRLGETIDGHKSVFSRVVRLLFICSPSAVAGFIIAVHVNTVDLHSHRLVSHILQESEEVIPPLTNGDSPTAVVLIGSVVRIVASLPHPYPSGVGSSSLSNRPKTVCSPRLGTFLPLETSTGCCSSIFHGGTKQDGLFSTFTENLPCGFVITVHSTKSQNRQSSESLSNQVFALHTVRIDDNGKVSSNSSI